LAFDIIVIVGKNKNERHSLLGIGGPSWDGTQAQLSGCGRGAQWVQCKLGSVEFDP